MESDKTLKDLELYHGTEHYYKVLGSKVTDGVYYIMNNGYSWFVTDFLSLVFCKHKNLRNQTFLSIKLKLEDSKGVMVVTDGDNHVLYEQKYSYTDAKREIDLFFTDNVLMLAGEY